MLHRIRERRRFGRFRSEGMRVRHGALWMSWIADEAADPPRVAFALGRTLGPAVTRNQLRRRLRALLADRAAAGRLPAGWYLVGASNSFSGKSFHELARDLDGCLARLRGPR